jgi:hypothetical protein
VHQTVTKITRNIQASPMMWATDNEDHQRSQQKYKNGNTMNEGNCLFFIVTTFTTRNNGE